MKRRGVAYFFILTNFSLLTNFVEMRAQIFSGGRVRKKVGSQTPKCFTQVLTDKYSLPSNFSILCNHNIKFLF